MPSIATFVLRHRGKILIFWLLAFLAGAGLASHTTKRLSSDFTIPSQPGFHTALQIRDTYGTGGPNSNPAVLVFQAPQGQRLNGADVTSYLSGLERDTPTLRVIDPFSQTPTAGLVSTNGRAALAVLQEPDPTGNSFADTQGEKLAAYAKSHTTAGTAQVQLTGYGRLQDTNGGNGPGLFVEILFGAGGALVVLAFVFASFLALLPIVVAAVSIPVTFGVLLPVTYGLDVNVIAQFLIGLIGLGVAIDYSLLLVTRWREERDKGLTNDDAVRVAIQQAGHSVVFSGCAVAIGLLSLTVLPVPWLRALGVSGMLIPLISTLVTITFTPAVLATIGPRIDRPRIRKEANASRAWTAWSRLIVRHPVPAALAAGVILIALCVPALGIKVGLSGVDSLSTSGPAFNGLQTVRAEGLPEGSLTPIEILVRGGQPQAVAAAARRVDGVAAAVAPASGVRGTDAIVEVLPTQATVNSSTTGVVTGIRAAVDGMPGVYGVTGIGAIQLDYSHAVYGNFPFLVAVLVLLTFLALARAFRSVVLAVKAVLLNLVSLGATFGAMTLVWQEGHGSGALFGISSTGAITFWVPIMVFAFLYGLSMDYEVFILTRMREAYDRDGSTPQAVVEGLGRTGRLVTSAALILFLAFVSLASSPGTDIKVMATGLGAGILLDATVVRALLVPALVTLFGRYNWWIPPAVARPLFVEPHAVIPEPRGELRPEPALV